MLRIILLKRRNVKTFALQGQDAVCCRLDSCDGSEVCDVLHQCRTPDREGVNNRLDPEGRIEHQGDLVVLDGIDAMRAPLLDLVDRDRLDAVSPQERSRAAGRDDIKTGIAQFAYRLDDRRLVFFLDTDKNLARGRQADIRTELRLGESLAELDSRSP